MPVSVGEEYAKSLRLIGFADSENEGFCMVLHPRESRFVVGLFSKSEAIQEISRQAAQDVGVDLDVHGPFFGATDPKLKKYQALIVDVEHPDESGLNWIDRVFQAPGFRSIAVILVSAFLTDAQLEVFRKRHAGAALVLVRAPIIVDTLRSMLSYVIERGNVARPQKAAQKHGREALEPRGGSDQEEAFVSLRALYERQAEQDSRKRLIEEETVVARLSEKELPAYYSESDVETLQRYLAIRDRDLNRLGQAFSKVNEQLDRTYATVDRLRLELVNMTNQKEEMQVQYLSAKDELERVRIRAERERQAIVEDFQIKLAQKEAVEGSYRELLERFDSFKRRIAQEVKMVRKHERELEQQIQLIRNDTELLLAAKDQRIVELSKKIESLYERIGLLNDKIRGGEDMVSAQLDRQTRVLKALRLASSVLEESSEEDEGSPIKKIA